MDRNSVEGKEGKKRQEKPIERFWKKINEWKGEVGEFFISLAPKKKEGVKYYRRLICCKLKDLKTMDAVIDGLLELGFTDITDEEPLGRRGSRSMLQYVLDDKIHRLHLRAHVIDKTGYLLVHKEPIPSKKVDDLLFHVRGFLERVGRQLNAFFTRMASNPQSVAVNYEERAELSDYEQGCQRFKELAKERDPDLYQLLDFYLEEHDFLAFSLKFGDVGKVLPIELLKMDFDKNVEASDMQAISGNIHTILDTIGFPAMERIPIKSKHAFIEFFPSLSNEMGSVVECLLHKEDNGELSFACFFSKRALSADFLARFVEFMHHLGSIYILIIFQKHDDAMAGQQDVKKLRKKNVHASHIAIQDFVALFEIFMKTPFSASDLLSSIHDNEILTRDTIKGLAGHKIDTQLGSRLLLDVLKYLESNPGWHLKKNLKGELIKGEEFAGVTEANLDHVFDFLRHPFLELVKERKGGKEISGIENKEEFQLKLANMKKMLGSINLRL